MWDKTGRRHGNVSLRSASRFALTLQVMAVVWAVAMAAPQGWMSRASAQVPRAGTSIGNQASASYTDGSGTQRTATSNPVTTIVTQVAGVDLEATQTVRGTAGQPVYFPHTVTNTGNAPDIFGLTATETADASNILNAGLLIFPDSNQDGRPDPGQPAITQSPNLQPGETFSFVVAGQIPDTATGAQPATVSVTATSTAPAGAPGTRTDTNTDTLQLTTNAVINVTKSVSSTQGAPGSGPFTYTLNYTNNGRIASGPLTLTDTLPAGLTYAPGTGFWSVGGTPGTPNLTDAPGGDPAGINYSVTGNTVTATIASVNPGASFYVSFGFNVAAGTSPGAKNNTASYTYDDDNNAGTPVIGPVNTNTVPFTVTASGGVTGTGDPAAGNQPVPQGGQTNFVNSFTNTGTGPDTFDITYPAVGAAGNNFPIGSAFQLFRASDASGANIAPLTDTNGNGTPDTGVLAAGGQVFIVLQVQLPPNASGTGPFNVNKTATSPTTGATVTVTDGIPSITPSAVDLTNRAGLTVVGGGTGVAGGNGLGPEASPINNYALAPGATIRIPLSVTNGGTLPANYNLSYSTTTGFAPPVLLPAGYTLSFENPAGGAITNTGNVPAGGTVNYVAVLTAPANAAPITQDIYFRIAESSNDGTAGSGAVDVLHDAFTVNTQRSISIDPNNSGQTFQGASVVYSHTLTNSGNQAETVTLNVANNQTGFTTVNYIDANNSGVIDAGDTVVPTGGTISVSAGGTVKILTQVFAPSGAAPGTVNVTTLTATGAGPGAPTSTATDTTTIVAGQLRLVKEQAADVNNDGTPEGAYGTSNISAAPNTGVRYRITVTNIGTTQVTNVVIADTTPAFTTYNAATGGPSATGPASLQLPDGSFQAANVAPANSGTGALNFTLATPLLPGQSVIVYFGVRVNG